VRAALLDNDTFESRAATGARLSRFCVDLMEKLKSAGASQVIDVIGDRTAAVRDGLLQEVGQVAMKLLGLSPG
jgi:hypothetical protein